MLRVFSENPATNPQIVRGVVSGKRLEILVEVGLIVVARLMRDPRPIDGLRQVDALEDVAKAIHTRDFFWRAADKALKLCDQVLLTDAHMVT